MTTTPPKHRWTPTKGLALVGGLCSLLLCGPALGAQGPAPSSEGARAFLRVELPKHAAYVGQSLPVTVRAYYRGDTAVTVTGAPVLANTDFTLSESDPQQASATLGGETYLVVTWKGHLSPVKAGHYALSMSLPSALKWQSVAMSRSAPQAEADSLFRDPFGGLFDDPSDGSPRDIMQQMQQRMQQMMRQAESSMEAGPMQQKDVVLRSPGATLDVVPLPTAGRPANFTGAVGHFEMSASAQPTQLRAGEPTTLALSVTGRGNFDRVDTSGLAESADWKTYPPSAKQTDDKTKVFTQAVVARQAGARVLPPIALSFFDPDAARYVTVETQPIRLEVSPGASMAAASSGAVPSVASGPALAPDSDGAGPPTPSLTPVFERRGFWLAQGVPLLGVGAAVMGILWRRRALADVHRPLRRRAARALASHRVEMDHAVNRGDAAAFFAAARGAFQQRLGARWHLRPEAITLSEIEGRLDGPEAQTIRNVFDSDAARFSGLGADTTDLARWRQVVNEQLHHMEER